MQSRWWGAVVVLTITGLTVTGCSEEDEPGSGPSLPPIATTAAAVTTAVVATTLPQYYEVQRGDTLTEIAAAYSIPVQALMDANLEISSPDDIQAGQFLRIPPRDGIVASALPATVPGQTVPTLPGVATVGPTSTP